MIELLQDVEIGVIVSVASGIIMVMLGYIIKQNATKSDVKAVQDDLDNHKRDDTNALRAIDERLARGETRFSRIEHDTRVNRESAIRQEEMTKAQDVVQDKILTLVTEIKQNGK